MSLPEPMFPQISHLLFYFTGTWIPLPGNTFGLFVALAFMVAFRVLKSEMRRRENAGEFKLEKVIVPVFTPVELNDVFTTTGIWALIGWKLGYGIMNWTQFSCDPGSVLASLDGNIYFGLAAAAIAGGLRYRDYLKTKGQEIRTEEQMLGPTRLLGKVLGMAFVAGIIGAKLFAFLEDWDGFIQDPIGSMLSLNGLTFYGGLITAGVVISWYLVKQGYNAFHMWDVFAPCLILAYGVGRMGCQLSGDGDWGILNSAYIVSADEKSVIAGPGDFERELNANEGYYQREFRPLIDLSAVPRASFQGPSFLPNWFFAFSYPNNVINNGIPVANCQSTPCTDAKYCERLPLPVFPTPMYEFFLGILIFGFLWSIRKKMKIHGQITGLYLVLNGLERFSIEKIRVNATLDFLGTRVTQAEIISSALMLAGIAVLLYVNLKKKPQNRVE